MRGIPVYTPVGMRGIPVYAPVGGRGVPGCTTRGGRGVPGVYYPGIMVGIHPSWYMPTYPPWVYPPIPPLSCPAIHHSLRGTLRSDEALGSRLGYPLGEEALRVLRSSFL